MNLSSFDAAVFAEILDNPGITSAQLMVLDYGNALKENPVYGRQRQVSRTIARLRKLGLVSDVARRCSECGCARTRGDRNVPLRAIA
jgi:hypothetical protein